MAHSMKPGYGMESIFLGKTWVLSPFSGLENCSLECYLLGSGVERTGLIPDAKGQVRNEADGADDHALLTCHDHLASDAVFAGCCIAL